MTKMTTSSLHLNAREVVVVGDRLKEQKNHLWLAFGCEGGGGGGRQVERPKKTTSGSCLDAREVVVVRWVETSKKTTSGSRLDVREVVVVAEALEGQK